HGRERARLLQAVEPADVEFVCLVDLPHHQLRLARMDEPRNTPRRLNLIDDPIPVADRLHCHPPASLPPFEKLLQRPPFMRDPLLTNQPTIRSYHRRQRVALVRIEGDILHRLRLLSRLTPPSVAHAHGILTVCGGAALSSHQRDSNPCFSLERACHRRVAPRPPEGAGLCPPRGGRGGGGGRPGPGCGGSAHRKRDAWARQTPSISRTAGGAAEPPSGDACAPLATPRGTPQEAWTRVTRCASHGAWEQQRAPALWDPSPEGESQRRRCGGEHES